MEYRIFTAEDARNYPGDPALFQPFEHHLQATIRSGAIRCFIYYDDFDEVVPNVAGIAKFYIKALTGRGFNVSLLSNGEGFVVNWRE